MRRWVLHIDMDAFFASCEQLTRPTLRGRPVLVGGASGRGVVAGASYEARKYGARSAMPIYQAKALVGFGAVVVTPRKEVYATASRRVFQIVAREAGVIEQLSIDEAYLEPQELVDAGEAEVSAWANHLRAVIWRETGLPCSIGAGSGKQYAKISSDLAKPDGVYVLPRERQPEVIGAMPVAALWGVGPVTEAKLHQLGVETIAELGALSRKEAEISLGNALGGNLWQLARGQDDRPVEPRAEAKQISAEHTYAVDLATRSQVDTAITRAAEGAHRRLLNDGRGARTVSVKLRMADFRIESRSITLPYATDEYATLKATAFRLARYPDEVGPIRLVGVSFSGLEAARQHLLFPELDQRPAPVVPEDSDYEVGVRSAAEVTEPVETTLEMAPGWRATQDVWHPGYGHGWVQGAGHGVVSVRFETRATTRGITRSFAEDDTELQPADPVDSLDWGEWLLESAAEDSDWEVPGQ